MYVSFHCPLHGPGVCIMGLFSRKKEGLPWNSFQWATNAPAHWPPVYSTRFRGGDDVSNILDFISNHLTSWNNVPGCTVKVSTFGRTYLDGNGILMAQIVVMDGNREHPVFVYGKSDAETAVRFAGVQAFLATRGIAPVYYAPKPLPAAPRPANPFQDLWFNDFSIENETGPSEPFSMWWPSRPDERFTGSACAADINRTMRALDGYNTVIFAVMGEQFRIGQGVRGPLPREPVVFFTKGPEERPVAISVSREKGIRFHFPERSTPPAYRDALWQAFAKSAEKFKDEAVRRIVCDGPVDRNGLVHWEQVLKVIKEQEVSGQMDDLHVGVVNIFPVK